MRWFRFRSRRRDRQPDANPRPPAGMDFLLAQFSTPDRITQTVSPAPQAATPEPPSLQSLIVAGEQAHRRSDWPASEAIWREVRQRFPHIWFAYTNSAAALIALQRTEDARHLLAQAAILFPLEPTISRDQAALEMALRQWPQAEKHWRTALTFGNRAWWMFTELASALEHQGRVPEAEAILLAAQAEDPNEPSLFINHARLAGVREDWETAVHRWAKVNRRFPYTEPNASGLYQAVLQLAERDPAAAERVQQELSLLPRQETAADSRRALMLKFESLGGAGPDGGCEFGGVQRVHGAEPLGLFRWAAVSPQALIACLQRRFERFAEADTTTVFPLGGMWEISDTAYGTSMHSFVPIQEMPQERMITLARNRMRYLKDKLIADLENPEKIFVLKAADRHPDPADLTTLGQALRSYGPGKLLCVCQADPRHPEDSIIPAASGVFLGYMDFSGRLSVAERQDRWMALCLRMLEINRHDDDGRPAE